MPDSPLIPPVPKSKDERARWEITGRRFRMAEGAWREDARKHEEGFFAPELRQWLPEPETSDNPALSVWSQIAILYDAAPTVQIEDPEADLSPVIRPVLWPLCQQRNLYVEALNECLIRIDWSSEGAEVRFRLVQPHMVTDLVQSRARPDQPTGLTEMRLRTNPTTKKEEWTWERWDVTDPAKPVFRVTRPVGDGKADLDVTGDYLTAEEKTRGYPYPDRSGAPIFPYILWHRFVSDAMFQPFKGEELVSGTLTASCLNTWLVAGFRDGMHPARVVIDGEAVPTKAVRGGGAPTEVAIGGPFSVTFIRSLQNRNASIGQWNPSVNPKDAAEAYEGFSARLAQFAGLSPSDIRRGSQSGGSGYAIVVSRDGLRRMQARQEPPARMGDTLLLATAARFTNAYGGTDLPENPDAWQVAYPGLPKTLEEIRADLEETKTLLEAGMLHPVDAFLRFNPGLTREQAAERLAEIREAMAEHTGGAGAGDAADTSRMGDAADEVRGALDALVAVTRRLDRASVGDAADEIEDVAEGLGEALRLLGGDSSDEGEE